MYFSTMSKFPFEGIWDTIDDHGVRKSCLPGCTEQRFYITLSETPYPGRTNFMWDKNFCLIIKKLHQTCLSERKPYLGNHE